MNEKEFYTPENIQKLVDQLTQLASEHAPDHDDAALLIALQHIYHREEERLSIERVRRRLTNRYDTFAPLTPARTANTEDSDDNHVILLPVDHAASPVTGKAARKPFSVPRLLSIVAAVLVIGFVVGNLYVVSRLFLHHTSAGSGSATPDNIYMGNGQTLYKLNGNTGIIVWQKKFTTSGDITVKAMDGMIYALQFHDIYAINPSDGSVKWHKQSAVDSYAALTAKDGTLYLNGSRLPDGRYSNTFFSAINARDGSERWRIAITINPGQLFTVQDGAIYISNDQEGKLYAIDAATGRIHWQSLEKPENDIVTSQPIVANGIVYQFQIRHVYAFNEKTGRLLWDHPLASGRAFFQAGVQNGVYYILSTILKQEDKPQIQAFDARTGTSLWTSPLGYDLLTSSSAPNGIAFANWPTPVGIPFAHSDRGTLTIGILDAQSGKVRWQSTVCPSSVRCTLDNAMIADSVL